MRYFNRVLISLILLLCITFTSRAMVKAQALNTPAPLPPALPPLKIKHMVYQPPKVETLDFMPRHVDKRRRPDIPLLFVIHETAVSKKQALRMLKSPAYGASYHTMIDRDGSILLVVPRAMKAAGAGRSRFNLEISEHTRHDPEFEPWKVPYRSDRDQAVIEKSGAPSVNDFGYQVELVSPPDGYWCLDSPSYANPLRCINHVPGQQKTHSGYTQEQYQSLVWLAHQMEIDPKRITTHKAVELSRRQSHTDPRSFDWKLFWKLYEDMTPELKVIDDVEK